MYSEDFSPTERKQIRAIERQARHDIRRSGEAPTMTGVWDAVMAAAGSIYGPWADGMADAGIIDTAAENLQDELGA